jgi:HAD superfamily hydrolase (TIGR01450 family)
VASVDLTRYEAVLLDLDGTVYHEDHPLPGAVELIRQLQQRKLRFACLSNSASSPLRVMNRLHVMGVDVEPDCIYTAAAAACDYVVGAFPVSSGDDAISTPAPSGVGHARRCARVFSLATESVREMLEGLVDWVQTGGEPCDVVIAGSPANVYATEERQRIALQLLRRGAALVGLSADRVYPSARGLEFGSGAMCALLAYAANTKPFFCGKPETIFFIELCNRIKADPMKCVLVGDNLESDVHGAKKVGMATILTLSGVTRKRDLLTISAEMQPDLVVQDLTELLT